MCDVHVSPLYKLVALCVEHHGVLPLLCLLSLLCVDMVDVLLAFLTNSDASSSGSAYALPMRSKLVLLRMGGAAVLNCDFVQPMLRGRRRCC